MLTRSCLAAFLTAACLLPSTGVAQTVDDLVQVDILPGWRGEDGRHMAGVRISLAPGWKTYWRAPGDAGIPPHFDWSGSENLSAVAFHWPVPQVSWPNGMRSIGYAGEVTLPMEVAARDATAPVRLSGTVMLGICEDVCVPVELDFDALLPATEGSRDPTIIAALVDRPMTAEEAGVGSVVCEVAPMEDGLRVTATMQMPRPYQSDTVIIETGDPEVWVSEPRVLAEGDALRAVSELLHVSGAPFALDRSAIRITVLADGGQAVDIRGCASG